MRLIDDGSECYFLDKPPYTPAIAGPISGNPGPNCGKAKRLSTTRRPLSPPVRLLFSAVSAAALAQPTDEPFDQERGQQESDGHAHVHIGENDSGAVLGGHSARTRFAINASVTSGSPRRFNALSCFHNGQVRLASPAPWSTTYTPCFCIPSEAARTINLRSSRSKRLASVRNSYANPSKAALVSSSLVL
jgi:hypothetical protein